jgi:hypothetical protein
MKGRRAGGRAGGAEARASQGGAAGARSRRVPPRRQSGRLVSTLWFSRKLPISVLDSSSASEAGARRAAARPGVRCASAARDRPAPHHPHARTSALLVRCARGGGQKGLREGGGGGGGGGGGWSRARGARGGRGGGAGDRGAGLCLRIKKLVWFYFHHVVIGVGFLLFHPWRRAPVRAGGAAARAAARRGRQGRRGAGRARGRGDPGARARPWGVPHAPRAARAGRRRRARGGRRAAGGGRGRRPPPPRGPRAARGRPALARRPAPPARWCASARPGLPPSASPLGGGRRRGPPAGAA